MSTNNLETEDTVIAMRRKGGIRVGIVSQVFEAEDSDSSDSESDDDDEKEQKLQQGQVRIEWHPTGKETKVSEEKVVLVDRTLLMGEMVCQSKKPDRIGFVTSVRSIADLKLLPSGHFVTKNVDLSRLSFVKEYDTNTQCFVLLDDMVATVTNVRLTLQLLSTKGYRCFLTVDDDSDILDLSVKGLIEESSFDTNQWYCGQPIEVQYELLRDAKWFANERPPIRILKKINSRTKASDESIMKFTVEKVQLESISIQQMHTWSDNIQSKAGIEVKNADLCKVRKLDQFEHQTAQVGERMKGKVELNDVIVTTAAWESEWKQRLTDGNIGDDQFQFCQHTNETTPTSTSCGVVNSTCEKSDASSDQYFTASDGSFSRTVGSISSTDDTLPLFNISRSTSVKHKTAAFKIKGNRRRYGMATASVPMAIKKKQSKKQDNVKFSVANVGSDFIGEIILQKSFVDVVWQDGTIDKSVPTTELAFADHDLDQHVFVPGNFVLHKEDDSLISSAFGVVRCVNTEQRLASVSWYAQTDQQGNLLPEPTFVRTDDCSVLDLTCHTDFHLFQPGAFVLLMSSDEKCDGDFSSKVGTVLQINAESGKVVVIWCNGQTNQVWPTLIAKALLGDDDDDESDEDSQSEDSFDFSPETEPELSTGIPVLNSPEERMHWMLDELLKQTAGVEKTLELTNKRLRKEGNAESSEHSQLYNNIREVLTTLIPMLIKNCTELPDQGSLGVELGELLQNISTTQVVSFPTLIDDFQRLVDLWKAAAEKEMTGLNGKLIALFDTTPHAEKEIAASNTNNDSKSVCADAVDDIKLSSTDRHLSDGIFELLTEVTAEHHYFGERLVVRNRHFVKAVQEELKLFQSLPYGVIVKAFENRMDLFSCMIVGPKDTPYENGLFLFDVRLPSEYPIEPPMVYYRSFASEQLNPNLYDDGKICVSLLGTWTGKGSERWNPGSSLLQVFVSIQGLILNSEPYFNEAGYESRKALPESAEKSRRYNEMALVRSLQNLTAIIGSPPSEFQKQVYDHAKNNVVSFISVVDGWLDGSIPCTFPLMPVSQGCRVSLQRQLRKLSQTLDKISFD